MARCAIRFLQAREMALVELNSATDNPLVFVKEGGGGDIISGGNFHGQPLAMAADQVAIALATLSGIAERRVEQMTNPLTSMLPAFLTPDPGLNSGFMIAQVTAAALTSEKNRSPRRIRSIPFPLRGIRKITFPWAWAGRAGWTDARESAEYSGD